MKKIEAIIRKEKFEELFKLLEKSGIGGMTVTEVQGFGKHRNGLQPKVKIEIYSDEFIVDKIIDMIFQVCRTNSSGDGKITIFELEDIYKISTGENGAIAI